MSENCVKPNSTTGAGAGLIQFSPWTENKGQETKTITIHAEPSSATIESVEIVGDDKDFFKLVTQLKPPFELNSTQAEGLKLTVAFDAKQPRLYRATLLIKYHGCGWANSPGELQITLRNQIDQVLRPTFTWACSSATLMFRRLAVGASETLSCKLTYKGSGPVSIEGATLSLTEGSDQKAFSITSPGFPARLNDGESTTVEVRFLPTSAKDARLVGKWSFQTDLPNAPDAVPPLIVAGEVSASRIAVLPAAAGCFDDAECQTSGAGWSCQNDDFLGRKRCTPPAGSKVVLAFPATSRGSKTSRTFWIRNVGDAPLKIDGIGWGSKVGFDLNIVTTGVSFPFSMAPKEQKEIAVEYAPSDDEADSGTIVVKSDAANPSDATLDVIVATSGCEIDVQPRKITYTGATSKQVTISNKGREPCTLKRVYLKSGTSDDFRLLPEPTPNQTIAPNGSVSFLVKFSPNKLPASRDYVVIESSDPDEPTIEVELVPGIGDPKECELLSTPVTLNFGLVPVGRSRKLPVTLENKGWGDCVLTKAAVVGTAPTNHTAFQLATTATMPLRISAGSNIRLDIVYTPPAERAGYEGELRIDSNDRQNFTYVVKLAGSSGVLCLELFPSSLNFGAAKFGCATPTQDVVIYHPGHGSCPPNITMTAFKIAQRTNGEFRLHQAPTVPRTLGQGQSVSVRLSYKPQDLGVDTGSLEITNDIPGQSPLLMPLVGEGVATNDQKDVFQQTRRPMSDVLFVLDNSGSTSAFLSATGQNVRSFINWAVRLNVDYHIMVTTMDLKTAPKAGGCAVGTTKIVTPTTADPLGTLAANLNVGTSGGATEEGLEAMYQALSLPALHSCNKGFYRDNARLSVFLMSNEPDQSSRSVDFYVQFLQHLKGLSRKHEVHVATVAGPVPSGCRSSTSGAAAAAPRYADFTKKMGGTFHSICTDNWGILMSDFGSKTFVFQTVFPLSRTADPSTISVKVNGSVVKQDPQNGWSFDATSNTVTFSQTQIPPPGATIEIIYKAVCLP